ncbi:hypothetical protein MVEG_09607 [Podila verticillata NRRL 6337]|nr:hypothetical protein MVEG_09607 [Podila verticillata NRRL 6337]
MTMVDDEATTNKTEKNKKRRTHSHTHTHTHTHTRNKKKGGLQSNSQKDKNKKIKKRPRTHTCTHTHKALKGYAMHLTALMHRQKEKKQDVVKNRLDVQGKQIEREGGM